MSEYEEKNLDILSGKFLMEKAAENILITMKGIER